MKASRIVVFGVAAIAALLLAFVVRGLVAGKGSKAASAQVAVAAVQVPTVKVLVAARDLKPGERLAEADLTWMEWPEASLVPAYITDGEVTTPLPPEEETKVEAKVKTAAKKAGDAAEKAMAPTAGMEAYLNGVVREEITKNEPITDRKIVRADEGGFMAVMLESGKRAMAVPISAENAAAGFVLPGDRVDIMVSREIPRANGNGNMQVVEPVLRNIKVLAIDQNLQAAADQQTVIGATATLELSPEDGQALALARSQGSLSLMLRSYADAGGASGRVTPEDTSQMTSNTVRVFRNGQASEVTVSR
ncbi:Flp pilus assembly protein CpaB [Asticcacaulis sp. ZE23SCel15]|uniref:Flp pilus assembly protein CpaB n=1 Tax=Asticcacaulis sp. ZE23SCel15 TaxID=3059027 RepID=UPI00265DFB2A|nr:Flp pilus assembly protein CpaB [Asticcacaulis sp. ZE23SCel15]WKL57912.1 Flp pilus assembly protein CpaB [Asticcacaulis sp. ZE23SCel15]